MAKIAALVDREDVLTKFDLALSLRTGASLDRSIQVVQHADALIKLRNAEIHFRPEWHDENASHAKLSRQLQYKFVPTPFLPNEPLFPRAWASASFADWAVKSAVGFMDYFTQQGNLPSKLEQFREGLSTLSDGAV